MNAKYDSHKELLAEICSEWNSAEEALKRSEQLVGDAIIPSINELRYAGRRLIEALCLIACEGDSQRIEDLLRDVRFDCHRAQHDAIDAAVLSIMKVTRVAEKKIGVSAILQAFPKYSELINGINAANETIAGSRANREKREESYATLNSTQFPSLTKLYGEFTASEPLMKRLAVGQRIRDAVAVISLIFGAVGIALYLFG